MTTELIRSLLEESARAPSVHNVQPARWLIEDAAVVLFEDLTRRLPAADPSGRDAAISLGAAAEGLALAAGRAGLRLRPEFPTVLAETPSLRPVMRYRLEPGGAPDPLAAFTDARRSWRGAFAPPTDFDRGAVSTLEAEDAAVLTGELQPVARLFDLTSLRFFHNDAFRAELLSWMRLSRRHPRWAFDGLNAEAMSLSLVEALGARVVLGAAFRPLDRLRLAPALLAEGGKITSAVAVIVFHRPFDEAPFESGRHFYRLWLRIEAAGFGAAVLAALADDPDAAGRLARMTGLPEERRVVSAFRIGRRPEGAPPQRARRPLEELLV
jgi:nitroreductase